MEPASRRARPASGDTPARPGTGKTPADRFARLCGACRRCPPRREVQREVEWTGTLEGTDPGFTNLATLDLHPKIGSPLVDAGINKTISPVGHAFPSPLALPAFMSPGPLLVAVGSAAPRIINGTAIDIGAFERSGVPQLPPKADAGAPPRADAGMPPKDSGLPPPPVDGAVARDDRSMPPADSAVATSDGAAPGKDGTVSAGDGESRPRPTEGCNHTGGTGDSPLSVLALLGVVAWRRRSKSF